MTVVVLGELLKFKVLPGLRVIPWSAAVRLVALFCVRVITEPRLALRVVEANVCDVTALLLPFKVRVPPPRVSTLALLIKSVGGARVERSTVSAPELAVSPPVKVSTTAPLRVSVPAPALVRLRPVPLIPPEAVNDFPEATLHVWLAPRTTAFASVKLFAEYDISIPPMPRVSVPAPVMEASALAALRLMPPQDADVGSVRAPPSEPPAQAATSPDPGALPPQLAPSVRLVPVLPLMRVAAGEPVTRANKHSAKAGQRSMRWVEEWGFMILGVGMVGIGVVFRVKRRIHGGLPPDVRPVFIMRGCCHNGFLRIIRLTLVLTEN